MPAYIQKCVTDDDFMKKHRDNRTTFKTGVEEGRFTLKLIEDLITNASARIFTAPPTEPHVDANFQICRSWAEADMFFVQTWPCANAGCGIGW